MKKLILLWAILLFLPINVISQNLGKIDFIAPFSNGLSIIQIEGKWAIENTNGDTVHFLSEKATDITPVKKNLKSPPEIRAKFIAKGLIAIKNEDETWSIKKV